MSIFIYCFYSKFLACVCIFWKPFFTPQERNRIIEDYPLREQDILAMFQRQIEEKERRKQNEARERELEKKQLEFQRKLDQNYSQDRNDFGFQVFSVQLYWHSSVLLIYLKLIHVPFSKSQKYFWMTWRWIFFWQKKGEMFLVGI